MSDRELLELAAKAEGDVYHWEYVENEYRDGRKIKQAYYSSLLEVTWNPLTDDRDALRLAVKLRISLHIRDQTYVQLEESAVWVPEQLDFPEDRYAATRRAIVRAAAEIGRGLM